jgi:hypothetical protein
MLVFISREFRKNLASLSRLFAASADRRFQFQKRRQLFIHTHNETLSITMGLAAIRVYDEDGNVIERTEHAGDFTEP